MQEGRLVSHGRARALQAGPVQARLAARRAAEGLPAPAADLAADVAQFQVVGATRRQGRLFPII